MTGGRHWAYQPKYRGRRVAPQRLGSLPTGLHTSRWASGSVGAGLYFVRLMMDGQPTATRQIIVE